MLSWAQSRDPVRLKVSAQTDPATHLAMIVQDVSPGTVIPVHLHEREDEIILIQSGTGVASLGETETPVGAGSVLWVPKGTWHGGRNTGPGILKWTGIYSPAGFEGCLREISRPPGVTPPQRSAEEWEVARPSLRDPVPALVRGRATASMMREWPRRPDDPARRPQRRRRVHRRAATGSASPPMARAPRWAPPGSCWSSSFPLC